MLSGNGLTLLSFLDCWAYLMRTERCAIPSRATLLVRRGEGELFCGMISRRRCLHTAHQRTNAELIYFTPSAYLNLCSRVWRGSRFTSSGFQPPSPQRGEGVFSAYLNSR